jgi:hypothetical protein
MESSSLAKQPFLSYALHYKILPYFSRESDHPSFTSLDFATLIFFRRARSSALRPTPNLEDQVPQ